MILEHMEDSFLQIVVDIEEVCSESKAVNVEVCSESKAVNVEVCSESKAVNAAAHGTEYFADCWWKFAFAKKPSSLAY